MTAPGLKHAFIIYAREDELIKNELLSYLEPVFESFAMTAWHDEKIYAGEEWNEKILTQIQKTDLFIMLVSAQSIKSVYIRNTELSHAIERHRANKSILVPVIIKSCQWQLSFQNMKFSLDKLQVLPKGQLPISQWKDDSEFYNAVADGVKEALDNRIAEHDRAEAEKRAATEASEKEKQRIQEEAYKKQQEELKDEEAWNLAVAANNLSAYKAYVRSFEQGKFINQANTAIEKINKQKREAKQKEELRLEDEFWEDVTQHPSVSGYNRYLKEYPDGQYAAKAQKSLDAFKREKEKKEAEKTKAAAEWALAQLLEKQDEQKEPVRTRPKPARKQASPRLVPFPTSQTEYIHYKYARDGWWWLFLPIIIAISVGAAVLGTALFYLMTSWIDPLNGIIYLSTNFIIVTGIAWGFTYAIVGGINATKRAETFSSLFIPYVMIGYNFWTGIFSAPVINMIAAQLILSTLNFISINTVGLLDQLFYIAGFMLIQLFVIISYSNKYD